MTLSRLTGIIALSAFIPLLAGCYEEPEVQMHEPGQYLGTRDPLLDVAGTSAQQERLADRLKMIQTDR